VRHRIIVQPSAQQDIAEAYGYLGGAIGWRADVWLERLDAAIQTLSDMPKRCALARENEHFPEEIRQLLFESYRVLFTIQGDRVVILHVRHKAQAPLQP
jgi:plasmid stabilization system protein ParE